MMSLLLITLRNLMEATIYLHLEIIRLHHRHQKKAKRIVISLDPVEDSLLKNQAQEHTSTPKNKQTTMKEIMNLCLI